MEARPRVGVSGSFAAGALAPFVEVVKLGGDAAGALDGYIVDGPVLLQSRDGAPVCDAAWLGDAVQRDRFFAQLFTHHRLRVALAAAPSPGAVVAAHSDHKMLYLAHSPVRYRELGRLVAAVGTVPAHEGASRYRAAAIDALSETASRGKHANVLEHLLGFLKRVLSSPEKREILDVIEAYRLGAHPLARPRALVWERIVRHGVGGWIARQVYWEPYPPALAGLGA